MTEACKDVLMNHRILDEAIFIQKEPLSLFSSYKHRSMLWAVSEREQKTKVKHNSVSVHFIHYRRSLNNHALFLMQFIALNHIFTVS